MKMTIFKTNKEAKGNNKIPKKRGKNKVWQKIQENKNKQMRDYLI